MTTESKLTGTNILLAAIALSFVAQFLEFQDGESYLTHTNNLQVYTGIHLDLNGNGTGWDRHPNVWLIFAGLAAGWFSPIRHHDAWVTWGPWLTVIGLWFTAGDSAPLRTSGGGLAFAAFLLSIRGALRARNERKAAEAAAAAARTAAASETAS